MNPLPDSIPSGPIKTLNLQCPACGGNDIETSRVEDRFRYGDAPHAVELVADVPLRNCAACGFEFLDGEAEDAQHEAVCRHLGVLTPAEIRSLRDQLGLSRAAFAKLTRLGEATLARWERGALVQTAAYDQFLYLLREERNIRKLRDRAHAVGRETTTLLDSENSPCFRVLHPTERDYARAKSFKLTIAA